MTSFNLSYSLWVLVLCHSSIALHLISSHRYVGLWAWSTSRCHLHQSKFHLYSTKPQRAPYQGWRRLPHPWWGELERERVCVSVCRKELKISSKLQESWRRERYGRRSGDESGVWGREDEGGEAKGGREREWMGMNQHISNAVTITLRYILQVQITFYQDETTHANAVLCMTNY